MRRLGYARVLAGALLGASAGWGIGVLLEREAINPWKGDLYSIFHVVPLGAVLGVRFAVGNTGVVRWPALVASWGLWVLLAWVMMEGLQYSHHSLAPGLLWNLGYLVAGWSAWVFRSIRSLDGNPAPLTAVSLASIGMLLERVLLVAAFWFANESGVDLESFRDWMLAGIFLAVLAGIAVCSVRVMANLAGRRDIPWSLVCFSAALGVGVMLGGFLLADQSGLLSSWFALFSMVAAELAWFFYWGHRLAKPLEDG